MPLRTLFLPYNQNVNNTTNFIFYIDMICSLAAADNSCTLGFTKTNKVRPMSLIKGNELRNPVMVDVILRKTTGSTSVDEVVVGDATTLSQFMGKIDRLVSRDLFSDL